MIAQRLADRGDEVVITGRDAARADVVAKEIGASARGLALDLARPTTLESSLADIREVDNLVITAIEQAVNSLPRL